LKQRSKIQVTLKGFFSHEAIALQSQSAPQASYILPLLRAQAFASAKSKRPFLPHMAHLC
jgi:hypothetical protein